MLLVKVKLIRLGKIKMDEGYAELKFTMGMGQRYHLVVGKPAGPIISRPMGLLGRLFKKIGSGDPIGIGPLEQAGQPKFRFPGCIFSSGILCSTTLIVDEQIGSFSRK